MRKQAWRLGTDMTKINFGSGPYPLAGWINVDIDPAGRPDVVADLGRPLPFATGVADFIHTEDFLAQLDPVPMQEFLRECRRILRPQGALRVLTPDLERFARMYLEDPAHLVRIWNTFVGVPLATGTACEVLNLGMRLAGRFQYDYATFSQLAASAGFDTARVAYNESRFEALRGLDLRRTDEAVSMYLECTPLA
jgi:SAM-dependent methyltransferase